MHRLSHDCFSWSLFLADYLWNFDRLIAAMLWISIVKHLKIWELQYFRGRLNIFLSFFWIINQLLTFKQSVLPYHVLLRAGSHTFTWVRQSQQPFNCAKDKGLECKQDVCDNSPKPLHRSVTFNNSEERRSRLQFAPESMFLFATAARGAGAVEKMAAVTWPPASLNNRYFSRLCSSWSWRKVSSKHKLALVHCKLSQQRFAENAFYQNRPYKNLFPNLSLR